MVMTETSENTKRIRATLRVLMSPGVWFVIAVQIGFLVALNVGSADPASSAPSMVRPFIIITLFMAVLFLLSGTFRSLAIHQERVTVKEIFSNGFVIFNQFLLLSFKTLGLLLLVFMFFSSFFLSGMDMEANKEGIRQLSLTAGIVAVIVNFIFIYWLPLVFVTNNFEVIKTLAASLQIAKARLPQSGFIAILVFVPAGISLLLPEGTELPAIVSLGLLGQVAGWIAYVYCAEFIAGHRNMAKLVDPGDVNPK